MMGGAGYNNLDWSFTPQDETGSGKAPIGDGRRLDEHDLSGLSETTGVLPEKIPGYGYTVSTDGRGRYLLYFVDGQLYKLKPCKTRQIAISLSLPPGRYSAETLNPRNGKRTDLPELVSNAETTAVSLRFSEDVALLLHREE
jgi:hypothetical protein